MWKRKRKAEWLPLYRARNYTGDLTEAEKRRLDAFRMQPTHPSPLWESLPEEVREYIIRIELALYDCNNERALGQAFVLTAIGVTLLFLNYIGCLGTNWSYAGAVLLVLPWIVYRYKWRMIKEAFRPSGAPHNIIEERIREIWELNYIIRNRRAKRDASSEE
jgi:hypothetical protein